jgi:hypothetical protein
MSNPFESLTYNKSAFRKSESWFTAEVNKLKNSAKFRPNNIMQKSSNYVTKLRPGELYMFFYDAKTKDKLPFWDTFPLVFPFRLTEETFFGLNLHYMSPMERTKILGKLYNFITTKTINENTRLRLSWDFIQSASNLHPLQNCVKQYRYDQVQSRILKVNAEDWISAVMLPTERFVGGSRNKVWTDTRRR